MCETELRSTCLWVPMLQWKRQPQSNNTSANVNWTKADLKRHTCLTPEEKKQHNFNRDGKHDTYVDKTEDNLATLRIQTWASCAPAGSCVAVGSAALGDSSGSCKPMTALSAFSSAFRPSSRESLESTL
eukprot:CAMPEP_0204216650 /NCGR_PEP_ID=MMETSP0361-20130328/78350_1 /ASSEMBLY_ACC=CAM_ASM_000343 /TAXON_ID=268821 /ORGANISM="Scrippsiella Hangoei, Strain SHTV-5" /LENGTH=128 /DNA_ID=CAMNT_0051181551 /DNA_START=129 /DNA_END=517 /DNA_ORIENTATION=+